MVQVVEVKVEPLKVHKKLNLQDQEDNAVEKQVEQKEVASVVREEEATFPSVCLLSSITRDHICVVEVAPTKYI